MALIRRLRHRPELSRRGACFVVASGALRFVLVLGFRARLRTRATDTSNDNYVPCTRRLTARVFKVLQAYARIMAMGGHEKSHVQTIAATGTIC